MGQILLPMVAGIAATKAELTSWVHERGMEALRELLRSDAEELAGKKGKHREDRAHYHWGRTAGELVFGGRRVQVERPRVRSRNGVERSLPSFEAFRQEDPLPEKVVNQILLGVSTRGYESSLDRPLARVRSRGTSKSAASRHLVTREGMEETLAVVKLELPDSLRRSLPTTNAVENLMGSIRRVTRNVKRWKNPEIVRRWPALGVVTARKRFRRIKGYREMSHYIALFEAIRIPLTRPRLSRRDVQRRSAVADDFQQRAGHGLEESLHRQIHLENNVLFPRALTS